MVSLSARLALPAFAALVAALPAIAEAQMNNRPWTFRSSDRTAVAFAIRNVEEGQNGSGGAGAANVCGGPAGNASATANFTCIIIGAGANAVVSTGQNSTGNQTANDTASIVDAIEEALAGQQ